MIKAILFDGDGVAIKRRERLFSDRFAEKQGISIEDVLPFFKKDLRQAFAGKLDIKESLKNYLSKWKWEGSVDDFLEHWFTTETPLDKEVLTHIDSLRAAGVKCYLATDREKHWAKYLIRNTKLGDHFDGFMFSYDIGHDKDDPEYFKKILGRLRLQPGEVMYWDDDPKNAEVAKNIGIDARFYTDLDALRRETASLLGRPYETEVA